MYSKNEVRRARGNPISNEIGTPGFRNHKCRGCKGDFAVACKPKPTYALLRVCLHRRCTSLTR